MFEKIDDVVFDTCVLFPPTFRDVIVQLAMNGCVNLRIPTIVLYELERVLAAKGHLDDVSARRATKRLAEAFLRRTDIQPMSVGDEGVLEYCISNQIKILVTENLKDFPESPQLRVLTFANYLRSIDSVGQGCLQIALRQLTARYRQPSMSVEEISMRLERLGVEGFSELFRLSTKNHHATLPAPESHPHLSKATPGDGS